MSASDLLGGEDVVGSLRPVTGQQNRAGAVTSPALIVKSDAIMNRGLTALRLAETQQELVSSYLARACSVL
jgi:hypothetical protein